MSINNTYSACLWLEAPAWCHSLNQFRIENSDLRFPVDYDYNIKVPLLRGLCQIILHWRASSVKWFCQQSCGVSRYWELKRWDGVTVTEKHLKEYLLRGTARWPKCISGRRTEAYMHNQIQRAQQKEGMEAGKMGGSRVMSIRQLIFVGVDEGSTTGYYTSPHKSTPMLGIIYTLLCLTSLVVMETSLSTPPMS